MKTNERWYWPAGLAELTMAQRAKALGLGRWPDGNYVVTRDGERHYLPRLAAALRKELGA